jgi:hypothetical protein
MSATLTLPRSYRTPTTASAIEHLDDAHLPDFLSAERALLVLTEGDDTRSAELAAELATLVAAGALSDLPVGVLDIASDDAMLFVAWSDWLVDIDALPYVALYRHGRRVEGFAASSGAYVLERLRRLDFLPEHAPARLAERTRSAA